jgi:leucyl aminopeptidase (aminopeptidase T)
MEAAREGVWNLVHNCAEVKAGESVLILNEYGKIDEEVAALITEAVKASGAEYFVLWGEPLDPKRRELPKALVDAMLASDKVIASYAINRAVLDGYTRGRGLVQINNTCRTPQAMQTPHATFHWGMVRAIYGRLEELFGAAQRWHVTSPAGTEMTGRIGSGSEVADAYFAQEAEASRFIRVFPGEVFSPVGAVDAEGTIVMEYVNMRDSRPWDAPAIITVKDNRITDVDPKGEEAKRFAAELDAAVKRFGDNATVIDSWHGGMNPRARVPTAENPSLVGVTSGAAMMHFHAGRTTDPLSAGLLNHTIEVDGRRIYEGGKLLILDDPAIQEAARQYGVEGLS